jgi:YD repeat-containing protein
MPYGATFTIVVAAYYETVAIDQNGRVWTWGYNSFGQLGAGTTNNSPLPVAVKLPAGVTIKTVAVGGSHCVALDSNGKAWTWGRNFSGQLGNGNNTNSVTPVAVTMPKDVTFKTVAAGESFTLALDTNGHAWAWGYNSDGELGNGNNANSFTPIAVSMPAGTTFTAIAGGSYHSIALDSNGRAWAWGFNPSGQLGNTTTTSSSSPVAVSTPSGVVFTAVAGGSDHCLALDSSGHAWAWGNNFVGQLGNGTMTNSSSPVAVSMPSGTTFSAIATAAGSYHSMALDGHGQAWAWGNNSSGELGDETMTLSALPVSVVMPSGITFTGVAGGSYHSVAIDSTGQAWTWGDNEEDELGNGTTTSSLTPVVVDTPNGTGFAAVSAGAGYSLALDSNGNAWAWGYNGNGQLGNGTANDSSIPVRVSMPAGVTFIAIAAHFYHSLALETNGNAWAWGYNGDGELGDGTTIDSSIPVPVKMPQGVTFSAVASGGGGHSLALDSAGHAWAWGYNSDGELGNGTTTNSSVPVAVTMPPTITFVAIAGGGNHNPSYVAPGADHSLAIDSSGRIWSWGSNAYGQLGNGTGSSTSTPLPLVMPAGISFTAVAGGGGPHSLASDSSGHAWAWGNGYFGELGNGSTNNSSSPVAVSMPSGVTFTAVVAGGWHSVALDSNSHVWGWGNDTSGQLGNGATTNSSVPVQAIGLGPATAVAAGVGHSLALAPPPVQLTAVSSKLMHGGAGPFSIDLPLTGNPGIECRSGGANGNYTLIFTFASPLTTVGGASVTAGTGSVSTSAIDPNDAHNYIVSLTGVTNAQYITVSLNNVTDSTGNFSAAVAGTMGVLIGDVNGSKRVDAADISLVRQQTLQSITSSNFREDINASDRIDAADVSIARQQTLTSLP